jgi:hypothetical protein
MAGKMGSAIRAGAAGCLAAAVFAAAALFPAWLRPRLEHEMFGACRGCSLGIESLRWHWAPFGLEAREVTLRAGDERDSLLAVRVHRLVLPLALREIFHGNWRVGRIFTEGVDVTVHEGPRHFDPLPNGGSAPPPFEAEGIDVHGASFTYRLDAPGGPAVLHFTGVSASAGEFGTSARLRGRPLDARAYAKFEGTGAVDLRVSAKYFEAPPYADVYLRLADLALDGMNGFLRPDDGVELGGRLVSGRGFVRVRGTRADGKVLARFEEFRVKFLHDGRKSGIQVFFANLVAKWKLRKENLEDPVEEARKGVVTERRERESVVSFVLRTLREGALRIAEK